MTVHTANQSRFVVNPEIVLESACATSCTPYRLSFHTYWAAFRAGFGAESTVSAILDSRFRACCQSPYARVEIDVRFSESLAMTEKCILCHCEERSDEAISRVSTGPKAGIQNC